MSETKKRKPAPRTIPLTAAEREHMARRDGPMHYWFELSYSSYLVLPRSLIQEMPVRWQKRMVALIDEMRAEFPRFGQDGDTDDNYRVHLIGDGNRFRRDPLSDYRHPDDALIARLRQKA